MILSGGLGPTEDDVTRDAVAMALDRRQIFNAEINDGIEQRFRQMNRAMPEINRRQAMVIEGAAVLPNDRGSAPGQWIEEGGAVVMLLPGPPHELKSMFTRQCLPRLQRIAPPLHIRTLQLRISGMTESELDQTIAPIYKRYENPVTTVLAHHGDIQVHLRARCPTEGEALALLAEVGGQIEAALGDRIISRNGDPLEAVVGKKLAGLHATLAVAESATGGGLAERIIQRPGQFRVFSGRLRDLYQAHEDGASRSARRASRPLRRGKPRDRRGHGDRRAPPHRRHVRAGGHGQRRPHHGWKRSPGGHGVYGAQRAARDRRDSPPMARRATARASGPSARKWRSIFYTGN